MVLLVKEVWEEPALQLFPKMPTEGFISIVHLEPKPNFLFPIIRYCRSLLPHFWKCEGLVDVKMILNKTESNLLIVQNWSDEKLYGKALSNYLGIYFQLFKEWAGSGELRSFGITNSNYELIE